MITIFLGPENRMDGCSPDNRSAYRILMKCIYLFQ